MLDIRLLAGSCPLSAIATRRAGRRKAGIVAERADLGSPHPGGKWLEQVERGLKRCALTFSRSYTRSQLDCDCFRGAFFTFLGKVNTLHQILSR